MPAPFDLLPHLLSGLLITALLQALPTAFGGVVLTTLYADALIRREGWDLNVRLAALEAAHGVEPPPPSVAAVEDLV